MMSEIQDHPFELTKRPARVYLERLSPTSRRTMRQALAAVAGLLEGSDKAVDEPERYPWHRLSRDQVRWLREELPRHYAPATVNKMLAAVRGVLRTAKTLGQLPTETRTDHVVVGNFAESELAGVAQHPNGVSRLERPLSWAELEQLMAQCAHDPRPAGRRDAALIALVAGTGLQRQAVVRLKLSDLDLGSGVLRANGQTQKPVRFRLSQGLLMALDDWLTERGEAQGPLLVPINRGGRFYWRAMTDQSAYEMLHRRADAAGLGGLTCRVLHYGPDGEPLQAATLSRNERTDHDPVADWQARELPYVPPTDAAVFT
jgi:integrase